MNEPNSSGSEYADAVRGVLERAAEIEGAAAEHATPSEPFLHRTPIVLTVFVTFVGVIGFNVWLTRRPQVPPVPPRVEEATAQVSAMIATQVVETFQEENEKLPDSLDELGLPEEQFDYVRRLMPGGGVRGGGAAP
jgi:hypothetical protein